MPTPRQLVAIFLLVAILFPATLFAADHAQSIPEPRVPNTEISLRLTSDEARIDLQRIDFWDDYIVFVGTWRALDGSVCVARTDFTLRINETEYQAMDRGITRQGYNMTAPGTGFFTQCVSGNTVEPILLPFAAPITQDDAILTFEGRTFPLPQPLAQLTEVTRAAIPTATPTPSNTPTPTPTPTPTFTPASAQLLDTRPVSFALPMPDDAYAVFQTGTVENDGIQFTLERIDYWPGLPNNVAPSNNEFIVLTGTLTRSDRHSGSSCVSAGDITLTIGDTPYEMDDMRAAQEFYQVDFPGYIFPQCVSGDSTEPTFFVFDVDIIAPIATLAFHNADLSLTLTSADELAQNAGDPADQNESTPNKSTQAGTALSPGAAIIATAVAAKADTANNAQSPSSATSTNAQASAPRSPATPAIPANAVAAQLLSVTDGDTIRVTLNGEEEIVRYVGIDTPERGQPGYRAATEANRALLADGSLYLVPDVTNRDNFGRLLRYIYTADGTFINQQMLAQGWAQPVEYTPDTRHAADFRAVTATAARNGAGFWGNQGSDGAMPYAISNSGVNIRRGPGTNFDVSGGIPADTPVTVFGRNQAGDWLQIRTPDRSGGWVFAELFTVNVAVAAIPIPDNIPVAVAAPPTSAPTTNNAPAPTTSAPSNPAPPQPAATEVPAAAPATITGGRITLYIIENYSTYEILGLRNDNSAPADISGAYLTGSRGDDSCTVPGGTVLQPGQVYQVATGDSQPGQPGHKCGNRPIWNNNGETIYLRLPDGTGMQIETRN